MEKLAKIQVLEVLRTVIDPEVGINIVDMGLVYDVIINNDEVEVRMTLTTQGCPMSNYITTEADAAVRSLDGVNLVMVNLVWDPPWSPDMIDPVALEEMKASRY